MGKQDNFSVNFSLKGYSSIQIGLYFLIASYAIKSMFDGFLIDDNPMGMMSAQIIEGLVFIIIFFTLLFSSLALFFKGRRKARKLDYKFWNAKTKSTFFKHLLSFLFIFIIIYLLSVKGLIDFIAPVFLILYGLLLYVLKIKKSKTLYVLSSVCFLLALLCFFIPNYWYSSIFILGIAHITYGIVVKN